VLTIAKCSSCAADIVWCITRNDKRMPVDAEPNPKGNIVLTERDSAAPSASYVGSFEQTDAPRYFSHFMTCEFAETHRRKR
jgi:hypothetical protein